MFYEKELKFLQRMLAKCHLQYAAIDPRKPLAEEMHGELSEFFHANNLGDSLYDLFPEIRSATIYRAADVFFCRYLFFMLPTCGDEKVFIVGPYLNMDHTSQEILELGERMGVSPKHIETLTLYYAALPVIQDERYLFSMINTFAEFLWSGNGDYESRDISFEASVIFEPHLSKQLLSSREDQSFRIQAMERRYEFENELIKAVTCGNIHKAEHMIASFSSLAFEQRVADPVRNMKNYCIVMNTLLRKAAENGGVHPIDLDRTSSDFAKRIENLHSLPAIQDFMLQMLRSYCVLVQKHSVKDYSPLVQKAIIRIENDLTGDLSLKTLARLAGVSPGYFSGLFKKETGQTLTRYVNQKRINLAKHLLKTTNLQVQTITQYCGVLDFHYFCRMFKEQVGKSPTEYRDRHSFHST